MRNSTSMRAPIALAVAVWIAAMADCRLVPSAAGQPLDVIVQSRDALHFFNTATGRVTSTVAVPFPGQRNGFVRDIVVDLNGDIHLMNGTIAPVLSTYRARTMTWEHIAPGDWEIGSTLTHGQIGQLDEYVFVPNSPPLPSTQLIRFDTRARTFARYGPFLRGHTRCTVGRDGLIYASRSDSELSIFDPTTLLQTGTIQIPVVIGGVAVSRDGMLYVSSQDGNLYRLDRSGQALASVRLANSMCADLAIDCDGNLVTGSRSEEIIFTDTALSTPRRYAWNWRLFPQVCFASPKRSAVVSGRENSVVGNPPNPTGLTASSSGPPAVGATWRPVVAPVMSNADGNFLVISAGAANRPTTMGTVLVDLGALVFLAIQPVGPAFAVPVPDDCNLIGLRLVAQSGSFVVGQGQQFANALDLIIGSF